MTTVSDYVWVSQLAQRYTQALELSETDEPALAAQLPTLQIASAALLKVQLDASHPGHTRHLAVIGPTQSGKSSLANVLLDTSAASASPLAGFTVHTQGYAEHISEADITYVDNMMAPLHRTSATSLDSEQLDCYVLEQVRTGSETLIEKTIVWDTPDFDSISANRYSLAVLKTAALADVVILVVSKDKYGDKRVWDMLGLLTSLGKPLLVCINKLDNADQAVVENAFSSRYLEQFGEPLPTLVMLPFVKHGGSAQFLRLDGHTRTTIRHALDTVFAGADRTTLMSYCKRFIRQHESQWLAPVIAEVEARDRWTEMVSSTIDEADEYYATHYLNNPDKYETFNKALAELLTLLEIPGMAPALAQARKFITWPARRLLGAGRSALGKAPEPRRDASGKVMDQEALILDQILDNTLVHLQRELLESSDNPWWQALDRNLRRELPGLRDRFATASEQARREFEPEIEKTAARLYGQLKTQPALLNTLRAARASADAAGIALAVKTGGLAPTDLILAPAMLSVTTLLTESALGRYLDSVKRELKQRQRQHVRKKLFENTLASDLRTAATELDKPDLLSNNLETELNRQLDKLRGTVP